MRRGFFAVGILVLFASVILAGCSLLRVPPSVDFDASVTGGAAPLIVAFDPVVEGATSYRWSFGDGGTSDELNPVHVYTDEGIYSVMLTVEFVDHAPVTLVKKRLVTVEESFRKAGTVYVYWVYTPDRSIRRTDWDGDWYRGLTELLTQQWYPPNGMDVGAGKVYWVTTTDYDARLSAMNLDGSFQQTLLVEENRLGDVAVDGKEGKIHWTCLPDSPRAAFEPDREWDGALKRANLDGSGVEVLVEYPAGSNIYADQVTVDPEAGVVFFSVVGDGFEGVIRMSRTSPFQPSDLMRGVGHPSDMTSDTVPDYGARNVYFTTNEEVRCVNLSCPEMRTIMTWYSLLTGIAVDRIANRLYVGTLGYPYVIGAQGGVVFALASGSYPRIVIPTDGSIGSVVLPR